MNQLIKCPYEGCQYSGSTHEEVEWHVTQMDERGLHEAQLSEDPIPFCLGCIKTPEELLEYVMAVEDTPETPSHYVKFNEGTYNRKNGHFLCTDCYLKVGAPSSPQGWKAP